MGHPWRLTASVAILAAASAVAFRAPVMWVQGWVLSGLYAWLVFPASIIAITALGWVYADVAGRHLSRWIESCILGTFVGWIVGYVAIEWVLVAPALAPEPSLMVAVEFAVQGYFFTGLLLAFAAMAGIGLARLRREAPRPATEDEGSPVAPLALLGLSLLSGIMVGGFALLNPGFPWSPDQFGVVQNVMTAIMPMIVFLLVFAIAWASSDLTADLPNPTPSLVLVVLGSIGGGIAVRIGWAVMVEPVVWTVGEILVAFTLGLPAVIVIASGLVCGRHGLSAAEPRRVKEILGDYTAEQPS